MAILEIIAGAFVKALLPYLEKALDGLFDQYMKAKLIKESKEENQVQITEAFNNETTEQTATDLNSMFNK